MLIDRSQELSIFRISIGQRHPIGQSHIYLPSSQATYIVANSEVD